jgi:hypothetical protein
VLAFPVSTARLCAEPERVAAREALAALSLPDDFWPELRAAVADALRDPETLTDRMRPWHLHLLEHRYVERCRGLDDPARLALFARYLDAPGTACGALLFDVERTSGTMWLERVECPSCGARPFEPCAQDVLDTRGYPLTHAVRARAAARADYDPFAGRAEVAALRTDDGLWVCVDQRESGPVVSRRGGNDGELERYAISRFTSARLVQRLYGGEVVPLPWRLSVWCPECRATEAHPCTDRPRERGSERRARDVYILPGVHAAREASAIRAATERAYEERGDPEPLPGMTLWGVRILRRRSSDEPWDRFFSHPPGPRGEVVEHWGHLAWDGGLDLRFLDDRTLFPDQSAAEAAIARGLHLQTAIGTDVHAVVAPSDIEAVEAVAVVGSEVAQPSGGPPSHPEVQPADRLAG